MKLVMRYIYKIVYWPVLIVLSLLHFPRFIGRSNLPEGPAVLCCNHSGLADPIWVVLATRPKQIPWIMAKKEVMDKPVIGRFLSWFGAFGVDRDNPDLQAVRRALQHLRDGDRLLIFPEGTRVKKGMQVEAKSGAIVLASRADAPIVPIYLTHQRKPFQPLRCIIGEPYRPALPERHPTQKELADCTAELMRKIYAMGETGK